MKTRWVQNFKPTNPRHRLRLLTGLGVIIMLTCLTLDLSASFELTAHIVIDVWGALMLLILGIRNPLSYQIQTTMTLSSAFAYMKGFFKTRRRQKWFALAFLFLAVQGTQYRFGIEFFWRNCINIIKAVFLCVFSLLFLLPELKKWLDTGQHPVTLLSPDIFSLQDMGILNKVLAGGKYSAIAADYGLAESTLKHRLHFLFIKIGVSDRIGFLAGYSRHILVLASGES